MLCCCTARQGAGWSGFTRSISETSDNWLRPDYRRKYALHEALSRIQALKAFPNLRKLQHETFQRPFPCDPVGSGNDPRLATLPVDIDATRIAVDEPAHLHAVRQPIVHPALRGRQP